MFKQVLTDFNFTYMNNKGAKLMSLAFSTFPCIPFKTESYEYDILMCWFVFYLVKLLQTTLIVGGWFIFFLMFSHLN